LEGTSIRLESDLPAELSRVLGALPSGK